MADPCSAAADLTAIPVPVPAPVVVLVLVAEAVVAEAEVAVSVSLRMEVVPLFLVTCTAFFRALSGKYDAALISEVEADESDETEEVRERTPTPLSLETELERAAVLLPTAAGRSSLGLAFLLADCI